MKLEEFQFEFPPELIAERSAGKGKTRILHVSRQAGQERKIIPAQQMTDLLQAGDCLVVNNTKVIPARIFGRKDTGGKVEALLIQPHPEENGWEAWVRPGKHFQPGKEVFFGEGDTQVRAETLRILKDGARILRFDCDEDAFKKLLYQEGKVPLPPYIQRESDERDKEDYQSVFARHEGAVAAPTASLHFSDAMMDEVRAKGVHVAELTLHVGPGTFQNVKVDDIEEHQMHSERYIMTEESADLINKARSAGGRIISVGTTATRVLETLADEQGVMHSGTGETDIFIYPGYKWKIVDGLLTNFHWPQSTLVMLVASLLGKDETLAHYEYAIKEKMQLFSYGDGMLIL
jgi:S-adenosylmethionine:tRNA ribosyltransferase-isomerase